MKIGVSSYSFAQYMGETKANYFQIIDLAKEMGYDAIEFIDLKLEVQPAESVKGSDIRTFPCSDAPAEAGVINTEDPGRSGMEST